MGWAELGPCWWGIPAGTARDGDSQQSPLSFQGFLSDLLKKANRPYDEPKLQEYTQTIVSGTSGLVLGDHALRRKGRFRPQPQGVSPPHSGWERGEEVAMGDQVPLVSRQLRMFDMNGDGKLGLSEMSR